MNTKKILSLLGLALFVAVLVSSCRSREKCPGVGSTNTVEVAEIG